MAALTRLVPRAPRLCRVALGYAALLGLGLTGGAAAADATSEWVAQALAYEHGEGVSKDQLKAAALYCDAARAGNLEALFSLGWMYANGRGVVHDDAAAAALFALAARGGHAHARTMLAYVGGQNNGRLPDCMRVSLRPTAAEPLADPFAQLTPSKKKIADAARKTAARYGVDARLVLAIIAAESNFEARAQSPKQASGVMQLIPATAERFNVKNPFDVNENMRGGVAYLRWLLAYYEGRVPLVVAAYNAGEAAVDKYRGIPPYPETREYVRRVTYLFRQARHSYDPRIVERSPIVSKPRAG